MHDSNDRHRAAGRYGARELTVAGTRYRIVLRGQLSERFESALDGMTLEYGPNQTLLAGDVRDQGNLYRLLDRVQVFGIELGAEFREEAVIRGREGGLI
jgi:hypothetical protein